MTFSARFLAALFATGGFVGQAVMAQTADPATCREEAQKIYAQETLAVEDWEAIREQVICASSDPVIGSDVSRLLAHALFLVPQTDEEFARSKTLLTAEVAVNPSDGVSAYFLASGIGNEWFGPKGESNQDCVYYDLSARAGFAGSFWPTGMCYLNGAHVEADEQKAFEWVMKAAELNDVNGLISAAVMHAIGQGTDADTIKAAEFYERAVVYSQPGSLDQMHALRGLGGMYAYDEIQAPNPATGVAMLQIAAEGGDEMAEQLIADLKESSTVLGYPDQGSIDSEIQRIKGLLTPTQ